MVAVSSVLVIGGGSGTAAVAILQIDAGVAVDLVDVKPDITTLASGITLRGNALRVLCQLDHDPAGDVPRLMAGITELVSMPA